jgi:hypothetical protein
MDIPPGCLAKRKIPALLLPLATYVANRLNWWRVSLSSLSYRGDIKSPTHAMRDSRVCLLTVLS